MSFLLSDISLSIIFITNVGLFLFFMLVLIGLIKTRKKTGNTVTNGMILERLGLVLFWLWNIVLTALSTSVLNEYYEVYLRDGFLVARAVIGVFLVAAVIYTLTGD